MKKIVIYDPESGNFNRIKKDGSIGKKTGNSPNPDGYGKIKIHGSFYKAHRIAHLLMTEEWPQNDIDHINHKKNDNRWCNLRNATQSQNQGNIKKYKNNKSGFKGVFFHKDKKRWYAKIKFNGKSKFLGYYDTPEEAHEAYKKAALEHFGEFAFFA